jgi:DNA-binding beta-propeller fold protein YncE
MPFANMDGLTYLAHADVLVASVDNNNPAAPQRKLIQINPRNGQWSEIVTLGIGRIFGLIYDPFTLALGGTNGSEFYVLQTGGSGTAVGTLGALDIEGLAYDPLGRVLYGTSVGNAAQSIGRLFTIGSSSGQGTPLGQLIDAQGNGYTAVEGLAFDPNTGTLYGSDTLRDKLVRINRTSGAVTPIGLLGFGDVAGLAFNPATNTLYGVDNATDRLIRISTVTGAGTAIGALGSSDVEGLEFDTASGILYGSDTLSLRLLRIHLTSGLATAVGTTGYKVDGLGGRIP